jgi:hypothetical protein
MTCTNCNEIKTSLENKDDSICNDCKLYLKDAYKIVNNNDVETILKNEIALESNGPFSKVPFNSIYYYLNEKILFPLENNLLYSDKIVLIIGSGPNENRNFALNLQQLKCKKLVCLNAQKTWAFDYFDDWIYADQKNLKNKLITLQKIKSYACTHNLQFDCVMTYYNANVAMTSFITDSLNIPGIPLSTVENIIDKNKFRNFCSSLNINSTKHFLIESAQRRSYMSELEKIKNDSSSVISPNNMEQLKLPLIVKNNFGLGKGRMILRVIFHLHLFRLIKNYFIFEKILLGKLKQSTILSSVYTIR